MALESELPGVDLSFAFKACGPKINIDKRNHYFHFGV